MEPRWNQLIQDRYLRSVREAADDELLARVIAQDGPVSILVSKVGTTHSRISGQLSNLIDAGSAFVPAVGDYVFVDRDTVSSIRSVVERRSVFERKQAGHRARAQVICANIDEALIVTTAPAAAVRDEADASSLHDFSVRRIERFVATLDPRVHPVVVVNKCDLIANPDRVRAAIKAELPGAEVVLISALAGTGFDQLMDRLPPGTTSVLVGSSGSGKSTLIQGLTGEELRTGTIRASDGRGRHTTTGRRMFALANGALLVDTPGMREVQLWAGDASTGSGELGSAADQLASAFPEIDAIAAECRFSDCRHQGEPGCAVQEAVREGRVTNDRYLSYLGLRDEQDVTMARREKQDRLDARRAARESRMRRRSRGS